MTCREKMKLEKIFREVVLVVQILMDIPKQNSVKEEISLILQRCMRLVQNVGIGRLKSDEKRLQKKWVRMF